MFAYHLPQGKSRNNSVGDRILRGRHSSAWFLLPRMSPEVLAQNNPGALKSQCETHYLKFSSHSGLLFPGVLQGTSHLLLGADPPESEDSATLQHVPSPPALPGTPDADCSLPGTELLTHLGAKFLYHPHPP